MGCVLVQALVSSRALNEAQAAGGNGPVLVEAWPPRGAGRESGTAPGFWEVRGMGSKDVPLLSPPQLSVSTPAK